MPVKLYMDVHVPQAITDQLRRHGVDIVTALEDSFESRPDIELLERARTLGRVILTQDIRFKALAQTWQREGRPFAGLLFAHQLGATIGELVRDLQLIANASDPHEWQNIVQYLPLR